MNNERRLEIFGILVIALSIFILVSLTGYNPMEEPTISPDVKLTNPMGIFGLFISHLFIKKGFGYITLIIPIIGIFWGWYLFSKKALKELKRLTGYLVASMFVISITFGLISEIFYQANPSRYSISGEIGGKVGKLFLDIFGIWGTILIVTTSILLIFRGYLNLSYYTPFVLAKAKWVLLLNKFYERRKLRNKEKKKKEHTERLKSKIEINRDLKNIEKSSLPEPKSEADKSNNNTLQTSTNKKLNQMQVESDKETMQPKNKEHDSEKVEEQHYLSQNQKNEIIKGKKSEENKVNIEELVKNEEIDIDEIAERKKPKRKYQLPSSELLKNPVNVSDALSRDELVERANYLTQSMSTFGVQGKVVNVHPGPVITLFEVEPAEGVRVNKFVQLADDLARVMEASSVRVIAPIPGKSSVGIEIPNRNPATVYFKSVINSPEFAGSENLLTLAIGKTTSGEISTLKLTKMPHLLIAGTTGSGKSVCINTIICSILYRATPDQVKFVMIDPKKVEMTLYKKLEGYHLLNMEDISEPIVTSVENAILALRALEKEMDRRYDILADAVVRNIDEYNSKMVSEKDIIMPYIVLVVDELADLMMLSAKDVEAPIARLAQLARAVGIHLVIATQRPSVDVITGVIKANFPSRIAFQVASKIDSRTIIDQPGADKLIGRGDMLHLGTGNADVFRMHNAFLTLEEIDAIMNHIVNQPKPQEIILPSIRESKSSEIGSDLDNVVEDSLFKEAVSLVITHQQGSISLLQRRLKVGYSRAARLIDKMEQARIVGPFTGSKAREVLVDESYLEMIKN